MKYEQNRNSIMVKFPIIVIASFIFFTSCSKGSADNNNYYFTCSINGVETTFEPLISIADTTLSSTYTYHISGIQISSKNILRFTFVNYNRTALTSGEYTGTNNSNLYISFFNQLLNKEYTNITFSNFTVKLNAINSVYTEGTFNGIVKDIFHQNDSLFISGGKFKVKF